jgi:hypothetical protein
VAIFSYDGGLYFGVTGDYEGAPDIEVLTAGIEHGMDDLLALVQPPEPAVDSGAGVRRKGRGSSPRPVGKAKLKASQKTG